MFKSIKIVNDKTTRKSLLVILIGWSFEHFKGSRIVKLDMTSEKTMRVEEIEKGQQEIQEKIAQMTKTVTSLTKEKGITDDPSLQRELMSWKDGIDPSIVPNLNDCCEQEELRKKSPGRSNQVDMQQRCSLLDKKLKEIEGVGDLGSIGP